MMVSKPASGLKVRDEPLSCSVADWKGIMMCYFGLAEVYRFKV